MRWLASALLLVACGASGPTAPSQGAQGDAALRYHVRLDAALSLAEVELCFRGGVSGSLIPGRSEAGYRLRYARWLSPGPIEKLPSPAGRISLPEGRSEGCIGYGVSLQDGGSLNAIVRRSGEDLLASPNAWLWRPYVRPQSLRAELSVELAKGLSASLPWPVQDGRYQLGASAFGFDSHAAFGRFRAVTVEVDGTPASVAILGALPRVDEPGLERWLSGAVRTAAQSDGRFPASLLQVIVVSEQGGNEPFGSIARGGGASVLMFVPNSYDAEQLRTDWVLPHELSHMLLPFVERDDAWFPEGLATYYQELLRARAGVLSQAQALHNLGSAMRSAAREGTGRTLCDESRGMHQTRAYRAVYWGGAAYWLLADVTLRQRTQGKRTVDQLLSSIRNNARLTPPYRASELIERLDQLSGTTVFGELAAQCERAPFPDYEQALRVLAAPEEHALRDALFSSNPD